MIDARGLLAKARSEVIRAFPERELFVRAGSSVRFHRVTGRHQFGLVVALAALVVWSVCASVGYFAAGRRIDTLTTDNARIAAERDAAQAQAHEAGRELLAAIGRAQGPFALLGDANRHGSAPLDGLAGISDEVRAHVAALTAELERSRAVQARLAVERDALLKEQTALQATIDRLGGQDRALGAKVATLEQQLRAAGAAHSAKVAEFNTLQDRMADLQQRLSTAEAAREAGRAEAAGLKAQIADLQQQHVAASAARDAKVADATALQSRIADLEQQLAASRQAQQALVQRLAAHVASSSNMAEHAITMTGLDVGRLLAEVHKEPRAASPASARTAPGEGGPFIAYRPGDAAQSGKSRFSNELEHMVALFDRQNERRENLTRILARLPLAAPIADEHVMSPFGPRLDPINGKLAFHTGIDLAGAVDARVMATAPGRVVFAGWNGGYGNTVEIDHGMGIHTRYAHLHKILVRSGQKITLHEVIGIVGSTGRSTGPHLHYEVLVDDRPCDPAKFLKAGAYVYSKD